MKAQLTVDDDERVREIKHVEQPWEASEASPVLAAIEYVRGMTGVLGVSETELASPPPRAFTPEQLRALL